MPTAIAIAPRSRPMRSSQLGSVSHLHLTARHVQARATVPPTAMAITVQSINLPKKRRCSQQHYVINSAIPAIDIIKS
jgi:hypothetical protein